MLDQHKPFYHATTRKLIAIFGALFDKMTIYPDQYSKEPFEVPIRFTSREKFLTMLEDVPEPYSPTSQYNTTYMAFELTGISYAAERNTNATKKMIPDLNSSLSKREMEGKFMYNRVPYDLNFVLYISSKNIEPTFMMVEQIIPSFKPAFNVTVNEIPDFKLDTDLSISLDSIGFEFNNEGLISEQRNIFWTLNFTMKAWYYPVIQHEALIKKINKYSYVLNSSFDKELDKDNWWIHTKTEVVPESATKDDVYEIKETIIEREDGV